ncbi:hypothetical protein JCM8547_003446 [Rhodosporidiobolus lusitaniae]
MLSKLALPVVALAASSLAAVTPTGPFGSSVFPVGGTCVAQWDLDTTGTWTNFSITLKTGANLNMVTLATIADDIDGTTGTGELEWTCQDVTPNSKIYFLEFAQAGQPTTWTTRFTISAADGSTTEPTEEDSDGIQWGTGRLVSGSGSSSSGAASSGSSAAASSGVSSASSAASTAASSSSSSAAEESSTSSASAETVTSTLSSSSASSSSSSSASSSAAAAQSASASAVQNNTSGAGRMGVKAGAALGLVAAGFAVLA